MTRIQVVLFLMLSATAQGADDRQQAAKPETAEEINRQIDALRQSGPLKEVRDVWDEVRRLEEALNPKRAEASARANKLMESPEYKAAAKRLAELEDRRASQWVVERKAIAEAAQKLYAERHAELRSVGAPELKAGKALGFDVLTYPRVDGSTSTQPMMLIVASRLLGVPYEWTYPPPTGSRFSRPRDPDGRFIPAARPMRDDDFNLANAHVIAKAGEGLGQQRVAMMINSVLAAPSNTHEAIVRLVEGKTDLVINVRGPSASEQKLADEKGVKLDLTPVAKDALVFIVNVKNPVQTLSSEAVRNIYHGPLTEWEQVGVSGAPDKRITAYTRDPDSGSRELFDALVMKGRAKPEKEPRPRLISHSMSGPFNQVTTDEGGIGYSVYYYDHFMAASPLTRPVAIDGVEPGPATIASGKYPYVTPVYAIRRAGEPADSGASRLLSWLLSDEGQAVVRESGYVPLK